MAKFNHATRKGFKFESRTYYYWTVGDPGKKPLFIFPGFTGEHSDQLELARCLKKKYFVIIPDFPGWGKSPRLKIGMTIENYAKFYHLLLENLGINKVTLLGHCMGTSIAIIYTLAYSQSIDKVFLVSPPYIEHTLSKEWFLFLAQAGRHSPKILKPLFYFWRGRLITTPISLLVIKFRSFRKKLLRVIKGIKDQQTQDEKTVEENWESFINFNYDEASRILKPVHVIHGGKDLLIGKDRALKLCSLLPNATLDIIKDAGHLPPLETPKALAGLVMSY